MEFIFYALIAYLSIAMLVAAWLGWYMVMRLDSFDWYYSKPEIWGMFIFAALLWPVVVIKPQNLINPAELFSGPYHLAARMREEDLLRSYPPACGETVRYRQSPGRGNETFGEFTFNSVDLERATIATLQENPNLAKEHEGAILNWLRQRDDSIKTPTAVPEAWWRFQFIADDELRAGRGEIYCLKCNTQIPDRLLRKQDDGGNAGWNFDRLICPAGHPLLDFESVHLSVRTREDSTPE